MAKCQQCGADVNWLAKNPGGLCNQCFHAKGERPVDAIEAGEDAAAAVIESAERIILTTEAAPGLLVDRRLDIITAEVVIGMHLFKDIASAWRDVFGGRSKGMQEGLREARKAALSELRREAASLGADAVLGVDLDYSEISGGGKSMLFLVASGTAVTLRSRA